MVDSMDPGYRIKSGTGPAGMTYLGLGSIYSYLCIVVLDWWMWAVIVPYNLTALLPSLEDAKRRLIPPYDIACFL
jgi:hypothetical protein